MPEGLRVEVLLEDTKYQDNLMKKYKLQDLVANGSHSRLKVDSDLLVGDIKNGYGYGDVLDANATKDVASDIADNKVNAAKQELIDLINQVGGGTEQDYAEILTAIEAIQAKNEAQDAKDAEIDRLLEQLEAKIQTTKPTVGGNNDNLIF